MATNYMATFGYMRLFHKVAFLMTYDLWPWRRWRHRALAARLWTLFSIYFSKMSNHKMLSV